MTDRPVEVGVETAPTGRRAPGRRRAAMSARDVAILRSLGDRIDPTDAGAHNNLGVVFFQKGLLEDAVAAFERALELDPRLEVARRNAEIALHRSGQLGPRIAQLRDQLRRAPGDAEARDALARTFLLAGDPESAAAEWEALLVERPDSLALHMKLAYAEAERGRPSDAVRLLTRALEIAPEEAAVHLQLAELHRAAGDAAVAERHAARAVALAPNDARAHALLAEVLGDSGRLEEAAEARELAASLDPAVVEPERNLSVERYLSAAVVRAARVSGSRAAADLGHYVRALELRRTGDLGGAARELERALAAGEDATEVRQALAELRLLRGENLAAAAAYERLVRDRPESPKLWNEKGVALHREGHLAEAQEAYRRAVATDPSYALAWSNLGVALAQRGDGGAERAFRKAAEGEAPAEVLWNLALHLGRQGRWVEAVEACRAALDEDDEVAEGWTRLGGALLQAGETGAAREALLRAVELDPDAAESRYQLGFALSALGDFPGALRETKRALELDPLFPAPRFRLLVDVQFEEGSLPAPERSAEAGERVPPGSPVREFEFEPGSLDRAFSALAVPSAEPRPAAYAEALEEARSALRKGLATRAADAAARAAALAPGAADPLLIQGHAHLRRGLAGEALERFEAVLTAGAGEHRDAAQVGRARSLLLLGRAREAADAAARAMGPEALATRARALLLAGDPAAAVRTYEALLAATPPDSAALTGCGEALLAVGRPADAEPVLRKAVALDPQAVAARVALGRALAALGDHARAEAEYEAAVETLPSFGEAVLGLADLRWRSGAREAAMRALIDFLALDPGHVEALVRLGVWLYEVGRPQHGLSALRRALRLDPGHAGARAELERLSPGAVA